MSALEEYVRSARAQGYSQSEIRKALEKAGYPKLRIALLLPEPRIAKVLMLLSAIIVILGVVLFLVQSSLERSQSPLVSSLVTTCTDPACFTTRAQECLPTVFKQIEVGSEVTYKIQECVLTKELTKFSDAEPVTVRNFFTGKTMRCAYERNNFDRALAQSLLGGLERCDGSLKEAIVQLQST